jgi:small subunit ribosomal protein S13
MFQFARERGVLWVEMLKNAWGEAFHLQGPSSMSREFRHIVRVVGTDVDGSKKIVYGLGKIRGVGSSFSFAVVRAAKVNPEARTGNLSEAEISRIEDVIRDPGKHGIPGRLFNRRKDLETGRDMHIVGPDLVLRQKADIDFMKDIRTWKGIRHTLGLKVRGQRTRTTGRSGKAVGVKKKVLLEAAKAAGRKAEEKK